MPNPADTYPAPSLRDRLQNLGIPEHNHRIDILTDMMPMQFQGEVFDSSPADAVAEVLIYLIGKGIIQAPTDVASAMDSFRPGSHVCQFYATKEDLTALWVPFFKSGLERNEQCLCIVSERLSADEARQAFAAGIPNFAEHAAVGRFAITHYRDFYFSGSGRLRSPEELIAVAVAKEEGALKSGFSGLRGAGDTSWLKPADWELFMEYETKLNAVLPQRCIVGMCTYCLGACDFDDITRAAKVHPHVVSKRNQWCHKIEKTPFSDAVLSQLKKGI